MTGIAQIGLILKNGYQKLNKYQFLIFIYRL